MGCEEIREMLATFVAGEANDSERIAVEAHLPLCPECRCEAERYAEACGVLAPLREGDVPSGTFERLWLRVSAAVASRRVSFSFDWVLRAAAVLVIGVGIGYILSASRGVAPTAAAPATVADEKAAAAPNTDVLPAANAGGGGPRSLMVDPGFRPRLKSPKTKLDGNHYLPRVEALIPGDEVDW